MRKLNAVIISAVYPPETFASARLGWDLATHLTKQGVHVTVLCPQPSRPTNADFSLYKNLSAPIVTQEDGVEVVRLPSFAAPQSRLLARSRESYSFGQHACWYLAKQGQQPDVLYVNAWPLLAQALIARYAQNNRIPMVLQVMDIYPESLLNKISGFLRHLVALPLISLDEWIAQQASSVVVISENMRSKYVNDRGVMSEKVSIINLWQDESLFESIPIREDICARYDVPVNKFTFLYLGNVGPIAGVDFLIRAFHNASLESAQLLIVGDGSAKAACMDLVDKLCAKNIYFFSCLDVTLVPLLQSMAHVCLLPVKRGAGMSSIPSKLPAYMFSAKPVIATVDCESDTARAIMQADCGWVGGAEDMEWLVNKIRESASLPADRLQTLGQNGRKYGLANYSKSRGVLRLAQLVLSAAKFPKE